MVFNGLFKTSSWGFVGRNAGARTRFWWFSIYICVNCQNKSFVGRTTRAAGGPGGVGTGADALGVGRAGAILLGAGMTPGLLRGLNKNVYFRGGRTVRVGRSSRATNKLLRGICNNSSDNALSGNSSQRSLATR